MRGDSWRRIAEAIDEEHTDSFGYKLYPAYPEAVAAALREAYGMGIRRGVVMAVGEARLAGLLADGGKEKLYALFFSGRRRRVANKG